MVPPKDFTDVLSPTEVTLQIKPDERFQLIDINSLLQDQADSFETYSKAVYTSYHTTAGYLDQNLCARLNHDSESVGTYVETFQKLFPPNADYRHDQMDLREELSQSQRLVEPLNADSHLTFIGSGLTNVVTYANEMDRPVYFVELDGVFKDQQRTRQTSVIGYNSGRVEKRIQYEVGVSNHSMDSINLRDERLGFFAELQSIADSLGIEKGRIDVSLVHDERNAGLTVNEYETLLMRRDLMEVLNNPMRFMAKKGYHMLRDPMAIPSKAKNYAKYDLVRVVNRFIDRVGLNESLVERAIDKLLAVPASRFLRMKRSFSLLVSDSDVQGKGQIRHGQYQSPILVQWNKANEQKRTLDVSFVRFE